MEEIFDAIVIGAGPAGCFFALEAGKRKLKTLVLEENSVIGEPVHCGECLSELAVKRLGLKIPEKVVSVRVKGVKVIFPNRKSAYIKEPGFVLEKEKFEQWLGKEAEKNGAKILLNEKVTEIKKEKEWKVKTAVGKEFFGKILIDASGTAYFLSKKLNLNQKFETVIGIQHRIQEIHNSGFLDFYLWPELAPEGYLWSIPKSGKRANIGLVTNQKTKANDFLKEFLKKEQWQKKKIEKTFGGLISSSGPLEKTFDDGVMLIGDAAGFTSPLFEGGTSLAMTSGKFAAEVAAKAIEKKDYSKEVLKEYESLWKKEFPDYNKIIKGKKALYSLTEDELNFFASIIPEDLGNITLFERIKIGFKIWFKKPQSMWKGIFSIAKGFGFSKAKNYGW